MQIFDGTSVDSQRVGQLCGIQKPNTIISSKETLVLKFETDNSISKKGFQVSFQEITGCGGNVTENGTKVTTPNFPEKYGRNVKCTWIIAAPQNHFIELKLDSFQLEFEALCRYVD